MHKNALKKLGAKSLWLSGGALRLALGGIGASLASFLLIEKFRRRRPDTREDRGDERKVSLNKSEGGEP